MSLVVSTWNAGFR